MKEYKTNKNTGIDYWPSYTITEQTQKTLTVQTIVRKKHGDIWYAQVVKQGVSDESLNPDPQHHLIEVLERMALSCHQVYILGIVDLKFPELFIEDYLQIEEEDRLKKAYSYLR